MGRVNAFQGLLDPSCPNHLRLTPPTPRLARVIQLIKGPLANPHQFRLCHFAEMRFWGQRIDFSKDISRKCMLFPCQTAIYFSDQSVPGDPLSSPPPCSPLWLTTRPARFCSPPPKNGHFGCFLGLLSKVKKIGVSKYLKNEAK